MAQSIDEIQDSSAFETMELQTAANLQISSIVTCQNCTLLFLLLYTD